LTYVINKKGIQELISHNAAAANIRCTLKMLRDWTRAYDDINASTKGCQKNRQLASAKEPKMEEELHTLFLQKQSIRRKIRSQWFYRNACLIYGNIYPERVIKEEGKQNTFKGFGFSQSWLASFVQRKGIFL
jgi:hypothetical protein